MLNGAMNGLFRSAKPLIGMVHLLPLPGSPGFGGDLAVVAERAVSDARHLQTAGFDGVIVENFGDVPYPAEPGPLERTVAMTVVVSEVRRAVTLPLGVNVQFNDYVAELTIARYAGADFVRVEAFVDNVMTAGGPVFACAPALTRLRAAQRGSPIHIVADLHVKETTPLSPTPLPVSARNAELAGAQALIVTGTATGEATPLEPVTEVKRATNLPVFIGSGVTARTALSSLVAADGAIVGTATKRGGVATNPVDLDLAREIVQAARDDHALTDVAFAHHAK
jgi:membrane complex biogenesis BtpA family protein